MKRISIIAALAIALGGCASPQQHDDLDHQLRKTAAERDALAVRCQEERAAAAALRDQLAEAMRRRDETRAEADVLRAHLASEKQAGAELARLIQEQGARTLSRPEIVRLPQAIDDALLRLAADSKNAMSYDRRRGAVKFQSDLLFDAGSDVLRKETTGPLADLARIAAMPEAADFEIVIVGHTDDTPVTRGDTLTRHPSNWHLSVHRAIAVKSMLVQSGLGESRVAVMGYGSQRPAGEDKAQNRRVEIFVTPRGDARALGEGAG